MPQNQTTLLSNAGVTDIRNTTKHIKALDQDGDEIFPASKTQVRYLEDVQVVTLNVESSKALRFQVDTGAQCNVIPEALYKKATSDYKLKQVTPSDNTTTAYEETTLPVVGRALIRVWRRETSCKLDCKLVDNSHIHPLLGRKACIGMKIITYLDNNAINLPPETMKRETVCFVSNPKSITKEQLIARYPKVVSDGVGELAGMYHIRLDPMHELVQHAPRRVPVVLWDKFKQTLDDMVQQEIITPVTVPTPWISSMVVVPKKNGDS